MKAILGQAEWRKSSYSGGTGNCVEVAGNLPGAVAVRDSKDPGGPALILASAAWRTLTRTVRNGELDLTATFVQPAKSPARPGLFAFIPEEDRPECGSPMTALMRALGQVATARSLKWF